MWLGPILDRGRGRETGPCLRWKGTWAWPPPEEGERAWLGLILMLDRTRGLAPILRLKRTRGLALRLEMEAGRGLRSFLDGEKRRDQAPLFEMKRRHGLGFLL